MHRKLIRSSHYILKVHTVNRHKGIYVEYFIAVVLHTYYDDSFNTVLSKQVYLFTVFFSPGTSYSAG